MNEQTVRFRLGIFVLASLILLGVLIVLFGSLPTFLQPSDRYKLVFDNAAGVSQGTPVRFAGVKIGEVEEIKLDEEAAKVTVTIRVGQNYIIRKSDVPTLVQGFLGSDASIEFIPAEPEPGLVPDHTPVPPGSVIPGVVRVDARSLVQEAGRLVPPAERALEDIRNTLNRYGKMAPLVEQTVREYRDLAVAAQKVVPTAQTTLKEYEVLAREVRLTLPALRRTNDEIFDLAKDLHVMVPELRRTNAEIQGTAVEARKAIPQIKKTADMVELAAQNWARVGERVDVFWQTNVDKLARTLADLQRTMEGVAGMVTPDNQKNFADILRNTQRASESFERVGANADALVQDFRKTLAKMDAAFTRANEVFADLQKVTKPLGAGGDKLTVNIHESSASLNATLKDVRELLRVFARNDGTVQRLLTDPTLYNRVDATSCAINRLLPRLDRILNDVEIFADRIARHPEALGVRGAIAPSSGLKELPPGPTVWPGQGP